MQLIMIIDYDAYETVVGLEVHAQLLTKSKLFCGDSSAFGSLPNTHVSAITLAHPGTLPKMNKKAIEFAVKMGLACHCEIVKENYLQGKIISTLIFRKDTRCRNIQLLFANRDILQFA